MSVFSNVIKPQGLEPLQFPTKFRSHSEAALHGSPRIEPEHVLLGLIHRHNDSARREGKDLPGRIFERSQLSVETVRNEVEASLQGSPVVRSREESTIGALEAHEVPFSSDTKRVLQHTAEEADRLRHSDIGTPHVKGGAKLDHRGGGKLDH